MSDARPRRSKSSHPLWSVYPHVYDILWDGALTDEVAAELVSQLPRGLPVEEVGAGTGLMTQRLLEAGYEVRASEPDERMATRLRRRLPELGVHRASIANLPPPATRPCAIVAANVLHLSRDPAGALFALRARAGDDGMVAIVIPAPSATVRAVAQARRCAGDGRAAAAAFVACHILLAPLELAGRSCVDHDRLADALESVEWRECREVRGISRVVSFPGLTGTSRAGSST